MSITRGEFLKSLGKSLPGLVASTGVVSAAQTVFRRIAQATPEQERSIMKPEAEEVEFLTRGRIDGATVALTFDDGPVPGITERILDILRAYEVPATFFMIGEKVAAAPDLARRVLAEGHELGHHTYTHRKATDLSDLAFAEELDRTNDLFGKVLGQRPAWFRPPYGALRQAQARLVRQREMKVAMWSLDSEDWRGGTSESLSERIRTHLDPGAIVLCHELGVTADSLDATLKHLREATQYACIRLSGMVCAEE